MPRIRDFQVSQQATTGLPETKASPNDFGAQIGSAMQDAGNSLSVAARVAAATNNRADGVEADLLTAKLHQQATLKFFDGQNNAAPGAKGFTQDFAGAFDQTADEVFKDASPAVKDAAREKIANLKTQFFDNAAAFEAKSGVSLVRNNAEDALKTMQNTVALNPAAYEDAVKNGSDLIDRLGPADGAPGLPNDLRAEFKRNFIEKTTSDYFEGRIRGAKSAQDIDSVLTEMADPKFTERLDPKDTSELIGRAGTQKRAIGEQANAAARASVDTLKSRLEAGERIDPAELAAADAKVNAAINPTISNEWRTLRARHKALEVARGLPKAAVDDALAQENGLPSSNGTPNYPALPAELNQSVNIATKATGGQISPDYVARTMVREAGGEIAKLRRGKPEFTPDVKDVRPAIRDAAAVAGEIFGVKLDAKGAAGNALDINTTGMAPEDKGRLADALVQAGFTGFAEYDNHLHVDFRDVVPKNFSATDQFGGWTRLSPDVMKTLMRHGFKAGQSATRIDRNGADGQPAKTGNLNFDFGTPTSTARGPFQFVEGTWLTALPLAAKKYGIDISGKSRAELLALRADPTIAAYVFGDFSLNNKRTLEAALHRSPNDAELYMAHFLGSGGAVNFIRAFQQQPNALAKDVVTPDAVAANKSVFINKNGTAKTVSDVYYEITGSFNNGVDALSHERVKALNSVSNEMRALSQPHGDAMTYAASNGVMQPASLTDAQGFAARGEQALNLEDYYKLPFPKPLTNDEVDGYKKRIEEGAVSDAVQALKEIGQLGGRAAEGAARQIGEQSELSAHLAGLFSQGGADATIAEDIIKGQRAITQDKGTRNALGSNDNGGTQRVFDAAVGSALDGTDPKTRAAIKSAADAYYVQKFSTRDGTRDDAKYGEAINVVLGSRLGSVNGKPTVLPPGVTSQQMDDAIDNLTQTDLLSLSATGDAPVDVFGRQIFPHTISVEGKIEHVGGDHYRVRLSDGNYAVVERVDSQGAPLPYIMRFDTKSVLELSTREQTITRRAAFSPRGIGRPPDPFDVRPSYAAAGGSDGFSTVERSFLAVLRGVEDAGLGGKSVQLYNDFIQRGRTEPISSSDFSAAELASFADLVRRKADRTGEREGRIDYKDYNENDISENILGGFKYSIAENGDIIIEDKYDFNTGGGKGSNSQIVQALAAFAAPKQLAGSIGHKVMPRSKGIPVRIIIQSGGRS